MKIDKLIILVALFTFLPAQLFAQEPATEPAKQLRMSQRERQVSQSEKARITAQGRQTVEALFERLCPGRCQLVSLNVRMERPKPVGQVTPGFESVSGSSYDANPKAINVNVLLDSKLPRNFQANIPRMIQYQLHTLAPKVLVKPELLNFPEPQLAPMAPYLPEPPQRSFQVPPRPEPPEALEPIVAEKVEPPIEATPVPEPSAFKDILKELAPWLGPILMALVLFGFALVLLRRISDLGKATALQGGTDEKKKTRNVDLDLVKEDFENNRALRNRVLRKWINEDQEGVADLVRWIGPHILVDLKKDSALQSQLTSIAGILASKNETLSFEEVEKLGVVAQTRLLSEKVVFDGSGKSDWEFLEGLGVNNLHRIVQGCTTDERVFVLGQLPRSLRGAYLETLSNAARKELVLGTSSKVMSKTDASSLAARLRRLSDEFSHIGRETDGQTMLVLEMVEVLALDEQVSMLRDLKLNRPEVSQNVLSRLVLETTTLLIPGEILADAIHRTPIETLTGFLRGTLPEVRDHFLKIAPGSKRQALSTELSLDLPVGRGEYLSSRDTVMKTLHSLAMRDGFDLFRANSRMLMDTRSGDGKDITQEIAG